MDVDKYVKSMYNKVVRNTVTPISLIAAFVVTLLPFFSELTEMALQINWLKWLAAFTGVFILSEAFWFMMERATEKEPEKWINWKNNFFIIVDIIIGSGILFLTLADKHFLVSSYFYLLIGAGVLSLLYRLGEYLFNKEKAFYQNKWVSIVNGVKILVITSLLFI